MEAGLELPAFSTFDAMASKVRRQVNTAICDSIHGRISPAERAGLLQLLEGWTIEPEDLAHISPYLTEHINRFGEYSTHELGIQPEAYDPKLDVDFTPLREQDPMAAGFGQAA